MLAFLNEQKMLKKLNLLELTCLKKLNDPVLLTMVRLEGLMFDHIYADLMMLVKSKDLKKSAFDMNIHYQELLSFLNLLAINPTCLLNSEAYVFSSELRLYSDDHRVNHRLHAQYISIRKELYKPTDNDTNHSLLLKMVCHVGQAMGEKLKSYKQDHLPDGRYYDPEKETQLVLSALQPHNDKVECFWYE